MNQPQPMFTKPPHFDWKAWAEYLEAELKLCAPQDAPLLLANRINFYTNNGERG